MDHRRLKIGYYPGCTARSTSSEYDESVRRTAECLGVELVEIDRWTCCGAASVAVVSQTLPLLLPSRNLALAEKVGCGMATPCPACFMRHRRAQVELDRDPARKREIAKSIGMELNGSLPVRHILDVLRHDVGLEAIRGRVQKPLRGLRVVSYYGCYLVRPVELAQPDDAEDPRSIDDFMAALGAEVMPWSGKVTCCGAGMTAAAPEIVELLVRRLVRDAVAAGGRAIVTACPMCHLNLDTCQENGARPGVPVFHFSELAALAFGENEVAKWLRRHLVDPFPLLSELGLP